MRHVLQHDCAACGFACALAEIGVAVLAIEVILAVMPSPQSTRTHQAPIHYCPHRLSSVLRCD